MRPVLAALLVGGFFLLQSPMAAAQDEEEWDEEYEELDGEEEPFEEPEEGYEEGAAARGGSTTTRTTSSEEDEDEDDDAPSEALVPPEEPEQRAFRAAPGIDGSTGGLHLADAGSGSHGSFRVALALEFFSTSDFLIANDSHEHVGGVFSVGWTPLPFLEVYTHLRSWSNSNDRQHPALLQVLGDSRLGAKVFTSVAPWLRLGGELGFAFPTGRNLGFGAFDLHVRALGTADLRELAEPAPLIIRSNVRYRLDNSSLLIEDVENARYASLPDARELANEDRHLITRVERFGLGINRTDFIDIMLGVEAPFRAGANLWIHPLLEWQLALPITRQGYDCLASPDPEADGCLDRVGFSALPMTLTIGVRILPPAKGLTAFAGVDLGLVGTSREDAVRELSQNAPWMLRLGVSYAFEVPPDPPAPRVEYRRVDRRVEVRDPVAPRGRILGWVQERQTLSPIEGAIIRYRGREVTDQVSAPNGRFVSYELDPGEVNLEITHPEFEDGTCSATIGPEGGDVEQRCELGRRLVIVEESEVIILEQIQFAFDSAEILEASFALMESVAAALRGNPQLRRIEIQGHTDDQGTDEYNASLSQRRADSVRQWLVDHGVEPGRVVARGYGESVPLVRETTDEARARNRRVQFIIMERSDGPTQANPTPAPEPAPAPPAPPAP